MALGLLWQSAMHLKSHFRKTQPATLRLLALGVALGGLPSCFEKPQPEETCEAGTLGCECRIDGECDARLSCVKDTCVLSDTGSGGKSSDADGTQTGGNGPAGGSIGSGDTTGETGTASGGSSDAGATSSAGAGAAAPDPGATGNPAGGDGDSAGSAGTGDAESSGGTGGTAGTGTSGKASAGTGNTVSSAGGTASTGGTAATGGSAGAGTGGWGPDGPPSGGHGGSASAGGAASTGGSAGAGVGGATGLPSSCLGCAVEGCVSARVACQADATCLSCMNTNYRSESCVGNAAYQALKSCFCNDFCAAVCASACI